MPQDHRQLFMKSSSAKKRDWFRVEMAWQDEETKSGETAKIYIYDEIGGGWFGGTSSDDFVQMLSGIHSNEIEVHLNTPGGAIFEGVAIYNALVAHPAKITVIVDALAASAGSFIAQAGNTEGNGGVVMTTGAMMMIHDGSGLAYGNAEVMRDTADLLDKLSDNVATIYAKHAGQTAEFWRNLMKEEVWYDADEAVEAKLATKVSGDTSDEDKQAAQNRWDLSIFNHASREGAPNPLEVQRRIANTLKENTVADGDDKTEEQKAADAAAAAAATKTEDEKTDEEKAAEAANPPAPVTPPPPAPAAPAVEDKGPVDFKFKLGGQETTNFAAVQARLDVLETFRTETMKAARDSFVDQLADDKKIGAPQVAGLKAYAQTLSDEGYTAWAATYEAAPVQSMLAFVTPGGGGNTPEGQAAATALEIHKDIVNNHEISGMSVDKIKATGSYKALIALDPTFKLKKEQ